MIEGIAVEQAVAVPLACCLPHYIHRGLQNIQVWPGRGCKARSETLNGAAQLVEVSHIVFGEEDHPRTAPGSFRHEPGLREYVDCFPDGTLRYAKFRGPFGLDDSHAGLQRTAENFLAQSIRQGVL